MLGKSAGTRRHGRPKLRWIDGLETIFTTSVFETGKTLPSTITDEGVGLSRPRRAPWAVAPVNDG